MTDREKITEELQSLRDFLMNKAFKENNNSTAHVLMHYRDVVIDTLNLLKKQEQEISRLKHHIDCDAAEKIPSGCVGFGRGFNDDEPCETCKECEKYNLYGVE